MRNRIIGIIALLAVCLLAGCDKSADIGGGYTIRSPWNPGHDNVANSLYYKSTKICDSIVTTYRHEDIVVFWGRCEAQGDQLFAVRGVGPRVLLSQRLVKNALAEQVLRNGPAETVYDLEDLSQTTNGVRAKFFVGVNEATGDKVFETHDLAWNAIGPMIDEAEKSSTVHADLYGAYRVLRRNLPPAATTIPAARS